MLPRSSSPSIARPASQQSRRHVVAITDSLRSQSVNGPQWSTSNQGLGHHATTSSKPRPILPPAAGTPLPTDPSEDPQSDVAHPLPERNAPFWGSSIGDLKQSGAVVNGFDHLDRSLMAMLHRLPHATLEEKFRTASRWIDSYHVDVVPGKLAQQLSLLLQSEEQPSGSDGEGFGSFLFSAAGGGGITEERTKPTVKAIIGSAFALHQLSVVLARVRPILGPVVRTMLHHIYRGLFTSASPDKTLPFEIIDVTTDAQQMAQVFKHFQYRTYYQEARDSNKKLAAVQQFVARHDAVRARFLKSVVKHDDQKRRLLVSFCFTSWRDTARQQRSSRVTQSKHEAVVSERDRLLAKVAELTERVAERDTTILELNGTIRQQNERNNIAAEAHRYDLFQMENQLAGITEELRQCREQLDTSIAQHKALQDQFERFRRVTAEQATYLAEEVIWPQRAEEVKDVIERICAMNKCSLQQGGLLPPLQPTVVAQIIHTLAVEAATPHRDSYTPAEGCHPAQKAFWDALVVGPDDVVATVAAPIPPVPTTLVPGHEGIELVALAAHRILGPSRVPFDSFVVPSILQATGAADKLRALSKQLVSAGVPLGIAGSDALLYENSPWPLFALASRLIQWSLSPLAAFALSGTPLSLESDPNPLQCVWEATKKASTQSAGAMAFDTLMISTIGPRVSWSAFETKRRVMTTAESSDRLPFTLSMKDVSALSRPFSEQELDSVQSLINAHFVFLRYLFLSYAGLEGGSLLTSTMSDFAFSRLAKDARLGLPGCVDAAAVKGIAGDGLSSKRFLLALVQLSLLRYSTSLSPVDALERLIDRIRCFALVQQVEPLVLGPVRDHLLLSSTLEDLRPDLMKVFRKYTSSAKMIVGEFSKMLLEVKATDDALSSADVQEAFALVGPVGGSIVFDQFCVLICIVGLMKVRAPWLPISTRIAKFAFEMIISPLQKKLQLQSVSL